ncbi:MAG: hypothetical protein ABL912_05155 [Novosphingobium sp.]
MNRLFPAVLALIAVTMAGPARAGQIVLETTSLTDIFAAYQAICLDHIGDATAQGRIAQAAPFDMKFDRTDDDGTVKYSNSKMFANVLDNGKTRNCMVTGRVPDETTLAQGIAVGDPVLGKLGEVYPMGNQGQIWQRKGVGEVTVYLHIQQTMPGQKIAAYMLGVEKVK